MIMIRGLIFGLAALRQSKENCIAGTTRHRVEVILAR